jgi:hypothetical protein
MSRFRDVLGESQGEFAHKFKIVLSLFSLAITGMVILNPIFAQTYRVEGTVLDRETETAIQGARITLLDPATRDTLQTDIYTEADGRYQATFLITSVNENQQPPTSYWMGDASPNPVSAALNDYVTIQYSAPNKHFAAPILEFYNALGQQINKTDYFTSGLYFYRLRFENGPTSETKKLILLSGGRVRFEIKLVHEDDIAASGNLSKSEDARKAATTRAVLFVIEKEGYISLEEAQSLEENTQNIYNFEILPVVTAPLLVAPEDSMIFRDRNRIKLIWRFQTDAMHYELEFTSDPDFSTIEYVFIINDTSTITIPLDQGIYYWRVRAKHARGALSRWSEIRNFKIDGPEAPYLLAPSDSSIWEDPNAPPMLIWNKTPNAVLYEIEVSPIHIFSDVEFLTISADTSLTATGLSSVWQFWRVRAQNSLGFWGEWSEVRKFHIGIVFIKTIGGAGGEGANSVQQTTEGGYILVGSTTSYGMGDSDIYLVKTNAYGIVEWDKTFGSIRKDAGNCVRQTIDGGYVMVGTTRPSDIADEDIIIIKVDSSGVEQWSRTFGTQAEDAFSPDEDIGRSIEKTMDGGYVVFGYTNSFGVSFTDVWIIKLDANGTEEWNRTISKRDWEIAWSGVETTDGGFIIAGWTSFAGSDTDILLIKTDSEGTKQWSRTFGGMRTDVCFAVQQTRDEGFVLTGWTSSYSSGDPEAFLLKTDVSGLEEWFRTFSGGILGNSVLQKANGGYAIVGDTASRERRGDVWLISTDANGFEQWSRTYGGVEREYGQSFQQTLDGGFILAGSTRSFGAGVGDVWLIKTDKKGESTF